jgi:hypothetical protein
LTTAKAAFAACGMALHACATERALAVLDGDDARIVRTDAWMRAEDIADPSAMSALLVL